MTRSQRASTPRSSTPQTESVPRSNLSNRTRSVPRSNLSNRSTRSVSSITNSNTIVVPKRRRKVRTCKDTHVFWKGTGRCRKKCFKHQTRILDEEDPRYGRCLMKCVKPRTERGPRYCRKPCGATHQRTDRKKGRGTRCVLRSN